MRKFVLSAILAIGLTAGNATAQTATTDPGVVINGVKWATRNVDAVGNFADTPESYGKLYQWNRKVAWSATEPASGIAVPGWDTSTPGGTEWEVAKDPSPAGWRVPTFAEIESLLDATKVDKAWDGTKKGYTFTDRTSNASVFFPAAGCRSNNNGALYGAGGCGYYWGGSQSGSSGACGFDFDGCRAVWYDSNDRSFGFSVRSVVDDGTAGVAQAESTPPVPVGYYTLLGVPLRQELASGVYIILYDNGTAEKRMR